MHNYIPKCSSSQPPATIKQMAPAAQQVDPRAMEQMMRELQQSQMTPMSSQDGVSITINIQPNKVSQSGRFNGSSLDRELDQQMMESAEAIQRGDFVLKRSHDLLSQTLNNAYQ